MFCGNCGNEIPSSNRFCRQCGTGVEEPASGGSANVSKGDVGVDRSTTTITQETHTHENSAKVDGGIHINMGDKGAAEPGLVLCPSCGLRNELRDTFFCRQCERDYLCRDHLDRKRRVCEECADSARAEAEEAAEEEKVAEAGPPTRITGPFGTELLLIPAGEFLMGSPEDEEGRVDDECQHRVKITEPFYMQTTPVTQAQWNGVMGENPSWFKGDHLPVDSVCWDDAQEFFQRLNVEHGMQCRLPTEAEWEYACRAGTTTPFYFGDTVTTEQANFDYRFAYGNASEGVHRGEATSVESFPPNAWGLYDMHGNIGEWCHDWYAEDYYKKSPPNDPRGPASGEKRVVRGGRWSVAPQNVRASSRYGIPPGVCMNYFGFRCAQSALILGSFWDQWHGSPGAAEANR